MVIRDTASHSGLPRGIHVHRDGRLTMDHNGGALPPSGSSAGGVPNGLAGELPHVMDAVAFATQALENLQGRLERTLRAKDAEMLSVQGRLDKAFESCRAEIEVVASTASEDLGAALEATQAGRKQAKHRRRRPELLTFDQPGVVARLGTPPCPRGG